MTIALSNLKSIVEIGLKLETGSWDILAVLQVTGQLSGLNFSKDNKISLTSNQLFGTLLTILKFVFHKLSGVLNLTN